MVASGSKIGEEAKQRPPLPTEISPSLFTLPGDLTYLGQGRQHDPECDFEGDLDVLVIHGEEGVLRGVVALRFLGSPADVLQDPILQQRLLQGSHLHGGLEEPGASQDGCSSVSLALHGPGHRSCSRWGG